jgi:hypothetical protein
VKTASAVPETSETAKKLIFNRFWRRANIIYMYGTWTSFENKKIYMA